MSRLDDSKSRLRDGQAEDDAAEEFGRRVRAVAENHGYSAADLGRKANIKKQSMSAYWNGARLCSSDRLFALADALRVDARWLITGDVSAEADEARLLQNFRVMDPEERNLMLSLAERVARPKN